MFLNKKKKQITKPPTNFVMLKFKLSPKAVLKKRKKGNISNISKQKKRMNHKEKTKYAISKSSQI